MINKILGILIFLVAIAGIVSGILLIPEYGEYGWTMLVTSLFFVLVAVVVYRRGVAGALRSVNDGTPKDLR